MCPIKIGIIYVIIKSTLSVNFESILASEFNYDKGVKRNEILDCEINSIFRTMYFDPQLRNDN